MNGRYAYEGLTGHQSGRLDTDELPGDRGSPQHCWHVSTAHRVTAIYGSGLEAAIKRHLNSDPPPLKPARTQKALLEESKEVRYEGVD